MTNTNTAGRVAFKCAKCNGRGRLDWTRNDDGVCYQCNGTGKLEISAAQHARNLASAEKREAAYAAEIAEEGRVSDLYQEALGMIDDGGLDGARRFYRAHPDDAGARGALVGALRDACNHARDSHPYMIAANKIATAVRS